MESTKCQPKSSGPITIYKIIRWPKETCSSHDVMPQLSEDPQVFEIAQTQDGIVASPDLPENSAYLANKILKKIIEKRTVKKNLSPVFYVCPYCHKSYENATLWKKHVNIHTGELKYPCHLCGKTFLDKSTMARHTKIHSGKKPWVCKICGKGFPALPSLRRHITTHNPAGRRFECEICHKRFPDKSSLQKHVFIHTGLRPHVCSVCDKSFVHVGDLNCHMKTHADKKDFICPHCKKEFSKQGNCQRHVKIHEGNKTYQCPVCEIKYNFQSSLTRHMVKHWQEKLKKCWFICRFCGARYANKSILKRHLLIHFAETVVQKGKIDTQTSELKRKPCESQNDINKRPLTHKEITFVRKNLKYCTVVQANEHPENNHNTVHSNVFGKNDTYFKNDSESKNKDMESITVDGQNELFPSLVSSESRKTMNCFAGCTEYVVGKFGYDNILRKKRRGRRKKMQPESTFCRSQNITDNSEQAEAAKLKAEAHTVTKRKRGRPKKLGFVNNTVTDKVGTHSELSEVNEVNSNCATAEKRRRGRPRKNFGPLCGNLSQNKGLENSDCISKSKRKRGRPRKGVVSVDNHISRVVSATNKSEQIIEPKRKRGRPRKSLNTFSDNDSNNLTPQITNIVSNVNENLTMCEAKTVHARDAGVEFLHDGKIKEFENFASASNITGNEQQQLLHADFIEAVPPSENIQTTTCEEKLENLRSRRKQTQPKQILDIEENSKRTWQNSESVFGGADIVGTTETLSSCTVTKMCMREYNVKSKMNKPEESKYDDAIIQNKVVLKDCQEVNENYNAIAVNLLHKALTDTNHLEKKCYSITRKSKGSLAFIDLGNENESSEPGSLQETHVITRNSHNPGQLHKNDCVEENKFEENCDHVRKNIAADARLICNEKTTEQMSHYTGARQNRQVEHFVMDIAEVTSVKNVGKRTKLVHDMYYVQNSAKLKTVTANILGLQELPQSNASGTMTVDTSARDTMKDVLLDDWQSDDSRGTETVEIVWENVDNSSEKF